MGVIHKLKQEVVDFVLENKKAKPDLSCRALVDLLQEKLQIKVSKSSINALFKQNNLSMPVGRRHKPKRKKFNMPVLPVIENINPSVTPEVKTQETVSNITPVVPPAEDKTNLEDTNVESRAENGDTPETEHKDADRVKEAEKWAETLMEKERLRIEQERLSRESETKPEKDDAVKEDLLDLQRIKEEQDAKARESAESGQDDIKLDEEQKPPLPQEPDASEMQHHEIAEDKSQVDIKKDAASGGKTGEDDAGKAETPDVEKREKEEEQSNLQKPKEEEAVRQEEKPELEREEKIKEEEEERARQAELQAERERWARLSAQEESMKKESSPPPAAIVKDVHEAGSVSGESFSGECSGVVLLKGLDYLLRCSSQLSEAIQRRLGYTKEEVEALTNNLIFKGIVGDAPGELNCITPYVLNRDKLSDYFSQLQELKTMKLDLSRLSANIFTQSRGVKMHFIDGEVVYLDAQMHTVWPTAYTSCDFSSTVTSVKDYINRYFFKNGDLILFMAPGKDIPSNEFFTLLSNFNSKHRTADNLILYGNNLDELENISLNPEEEHNVTFALWPWQFTAYRKVRRIGQFVQKHIDSIDKDIYLAEIEMELSQPSGMQSLSIKGCAIKLSPEGKIPLVILSTNTAKDMVSLTNDYLGRWPNLDEGLHDFNRKIELFSCTGEIQQVFAYENLPLAQSEPADLGSVFHGCLEALDAYLRWHFMPSGYDKIPMAVTKERLYSQKGEILSGSGKVRYVLSIDKDYAYAKDIEYTCCRLNERDIRDGNGQRVRFESTFK